jgi:hypothetical protein
MHAIWDNLIRDQNNIPIVVGSTRIEKFYPLRSHRSATLPKNVPLLGKQEAIGVSLLRQELADAFGSKAITLYQAEDFGPSKARFNFVSIGGGSINDVTRDFSDEHRIDAKFKMLYPDHYAIDEYDRTTYRAELQDGILTKDYGFIIIGPNSYDRRKKVILAYGIWPQGTHAAIEALLRPDIVSPLGQAFVERVKSGRGVVAVVETAVINLEQGPPIFVKVRDLAEK